MWLAIVSILIFPQFSTPPGSFRIIVTVARHADNQKLTLVWGDTYGKLGSSEIPMDGRSPVQYVKVLERLPPGEYTFVAVLQRGDKKFSDTKGFMVTGG